MGFVAGDFSANRNRSLHDLFKDLDLSRTFHYSKCCVEKFVCRSRGLSLMGCTQQVLRTRAQCSVRKWRIYTCWCRSAALPVILCVLLSTFLKLWILWSPNVWPVSYPNILLSRPIYIFLPLPSLLSFGLSLHVLPFVLSKLVRANLENPCWDFIFGQVCRHNLSLGLGFLHLLSLFLIACFKSNTPVLSALHGSLPAGVCTTIPRSVLLLTFFIGI